MAFLSHCKAVLGVAGTGGTYAQYKLASDAELQAMEQSYYKLSDSINQMKYDLKEMQRQLNGGY